jgi:hypothetical protein
MTQYDKDELEWTEETADLLRKGKLSEIDKETLAEVLEDMGKNLRRELKSKLRVLIMHLLKYQYQPIARSSGWLGTIREQRASMIDLMEDSPSLKKLLSQYLSTEYLNARKGAAIETGIPLSMFPESCQYTLKEIMDDDFLP